MNINSVKMSKYFPLQTTSKDIVPSVPFSLSNAINSPPKKDITTKNNNNAIDIYEEMRHQATTARMNVPASFDSLTSQNRKLPGVFTISANQLRELQQKYDLESMVPGEYLSTLRKAISEGKGIGVAVTVIGELYEHESGENPSEFDWRQMMAKIFENMEMDDEKENEKTAIAKPPEGVELLDQSEKKFVDLLKSLNKDTVSGQYAYGGITFMWPVS